MSRRKSYSDTFTGQADENIRGILFGSEEPQYARLKRILLKVINNDLTPRQKEIIMLYYFKDMDTSEIAEMLGVSPQAVSAVRARARLRLMKILRYYM